MPKGVQHVQCTYMSSDIRRHQSLPAIYLCLHHVFMYICVCVCVCVNAVKANAADMPGMDLRDHAYTRMGNWFCMILTRAYKSNFQCTPACTHTYLGVTFIDAGIHMHTCTHAYIHVHRSGWMSQKVDIHTHMSIHTSDG
jgi:hypothetical protein